MNIKDSLDWAAKKLRQNNIDSASLDAELLLSLALNQPREFLYVRPDYLPTKAQRKKFEKLIRRRAEFEPTAYLIGHKEFYGLKFIVNKNVLIPRPESEEIIDKTLKIIESRYTIRDSRYAIRDTRFTICDLGTGSGCLIISLAKELQKLNLIDRFELIATDISRQALKTAHENAKLHQVENLITFLKGKLFSPVKSRRIDLIMTNLPYLTKADVKKEPSIKKEPRKALIGDYAKFFKQLEDLNPRPTVIYEDKNGVNIF